MKCDPKRYNKTSEYIAALKIMLREREAQRERERETDRQTDIQTDREKKGGGGTKRTSLI